MAIYSRRNQYVGVNAHLQSMLQTPGTANDYSLWPSFHQQYIVHTVVFLNQQLPSGYFAVNEQSLQIFGESELGKRVLRRPEPEISIHRGPKPLQDQSPSETKSTSFPTWQSIIEATLDVESTMSAVVIYQVGEHRRLGKPVVRMELLSPSNKPGGENYRAYSINRKEALHSGVPLIEIDFLHEQKSPILTLPAYPADDDSHPYSIGVSDPRSLEERGPVVVYGFDVDAPISCVDIPLDNQLLAFDFGDPYQQAFETGYWGQFVDYEESLIRFDTYRADDQQRIRARMQAVMRAHQQGKDLEQGPYPIED
jgi:hypothetical protein